MSQGKVVERDFQRFAKFAPEGRPRMPEGYSAPLDMRPLSVLIAERIRNLRAARDAVVA